MGSKLQHGLLSPYLLNRYFAISNFKSLSWSTKSADDGRVYTFMMPLQGLPYLQYIDLTTSKAARGSEEAISSEDVPP